VALRPARLLPPKRLLTPRSARRLSTTYRGLLPGSPAITRVAIGSQGRGAASGPVPHPPFNPYVRFSRIRLTDGLLDMVTLPSGSG
jgi:hypothetical protein